MKPQTLCIVVFIFIFIERNEGEKFTACEKGITPNVKLRQDYGVACSYPPCQLKPDIDLHLTISFEATINLSRLRPELIFSEAGQKKYVDVGTDACQDLTQGKCPIEQGYPVIYYKTIKVDASWIKQIAGMQYSIIDEVSNSTIACFYVKVYSA